MEIGQSLDSFKDIELYIMAMAVGMARMSAMMVVMPAFTRLGLTGIIRGGAAMVLSLPLLPLIAPVIISENMVFTQLAAILLKEAIVGVLIGLVLGVPIWAAETSGEILDMQRGANFPELADPSNSSQNNVLGTFMALTMVTLFFLSGGLAITLRTVYDSYTLWPLTSFVPIFSTESVQILLTLLDDLIGMGLILVSPIVLSLLLADLSLALVARAVPQMNVFVLSLPVKSLLMMFLLVLYCAFFIHYLKDTLGLLYEGGSKLEIIAPDSSAEKQ